MAKSIEQEVRDLRHDLSIHEGLNSHLNDNCFLLSERLSELETRVGDLELAFSIATGNHPRDAKK